MSVQVDLMAVLTGQLVKTQEGQKSFELYHALSTVFKEGAWNCECKNGTVGNGFVCDDVDECEAKSSK